MKSYAKAQQQDGREMWTKQSQSFQIIKLEIVFPRVEKFSPLRVVLSQIHNKPLSYFMLAGSSLNWWTVEEMAWHSHRDWQLEMTTWFRSWNTEILFPSPFQIVLFPLSQRLRLRLSLFSRDRGKMATGNQNTVILRKALGNQPYHRRFPRTWKVSGKAEN